MSSLYLPVLAQVTLTVLVFITLAVVKAKAAKRGEIDRVKTALHDDAWPESVMKVNNNIRNQFQTPVLFYVLCFMLVQLNAVGPVVLGLAWAFVATRVLHAWIHITSNFVPRRRAVFMLGCLILIGLLGMAVHALLTV